MCSNEYRSCARMAILLAVVFIGRAICVAHLNAAELTCDDFSFYGPLGSPGASIVKIGPSHFRVEIPLAYKNPQWTNMLQFTITDHAMGNSLQIEAGETGFSSNEMGLRKFGSWSYDMQNWHPIQAKKVNGVRTLVFPEFTQNRVYFGGEVPMSYEQYENMIHDWSKHPHANLKVIGKSIEGRKLYRLSITDPNSPLAPEKRRGHHFVNQHCYEYNAMWRIAGMIDWLLGDEGADCRKGHIAHFVVMMNVDGPSHGFARVNCEGIDMNRSYSHMGSDRQKQAIEAYYVQKDLEEINAKTPLTTTWSMHTWDGKKIDLLARQGKDMDKQQELGGMDRFIETIKRNDVKSQFNPVQNITTTWKLNPECWCSGTHMQFGVTAFCCEGGGDMYTKDENLHVGKVLMKTLYHYYTVISDKNIDECGGPSCIKRIPREKLDK